MLKRIWEGWKRFGQWIGDMLARVVLTVFYFTIFVPFGLGVRFFSDPLAIKTRPAGFAVIPPPGAMIPRPPGRGGRSRRR